MRRLSEFCTVAAVPDERWDGGDCWREVIGDTVCSFWFVGLIRFGARGDSRSPSSEGLLRFTAIRANRTGDTAAKKVGEEG